MLTSPTGFLLVARSDHATGITNIKPEVVFKVQKMARHASFYLIMGSFKGKVPVCQIMARVSFTMGQYGRHLSNSWASCTNNVMFSYQRADEHFVVWFAGWRCRWAWPLAGRRPLRPSGSLTRRAGLLGLPGSWGRVCRGSGAPVVALADRRLDSAASGDIGGFGARCGVSSCALC